MTIKGGSSVEIIVHRVTVTRVKLTGRQVGGRILDRGPCPPFPQVHLPVEVLPSAYERRQRAQDASRVMPPDPFFMTIRSDPAVTILERLWADGSGAGAQGTPEQIASPTNK
jgi:hypothetical protein